MVYDNRPNLRAMLAALLLDGTKDISGDGTTSLSEVVGLPPLPPCDRKILFWDTVNRIKELNVKHANLEEGE